MFVISPYRSTNASAIYQNFQETQKKKKDFFQEKHHVPPQKDPESIINHTNKNYRMKKISVHEFLELR